VEKEADVQSLTDILAKFTAYIGKRLPTDVKDKQAELRAKETNPMAIEIFDVMAENQDAADMRIPANVTGHSGDRDRFAHGHHTGVGFVL